MCVKWYDHKQTDITSDRVYPKYDESIQTAHRRTQCFNNP